jgi:hypothetical protein
MLEAAGRQAQSRASSGLLANAPLVRMLFSAASVSVVYVGLG